MTTNIRQQGAHVRFAPGHRSPGRARSWKGRFSSANAGAGWRIGCSPSFAFLKPARRGVGFALQAHCGCAVEMGVVAVRAVAMREFQ
jgi:hypothetical protein